MQGWVDLVGLVTYQGGIPARRPSPIPVLTRFSVEQLCLYDERRYHSAKGKVNKRIAVFATSTARYGNSHAIWDYTVLPATRQRWHFRQPPSIAGSVYSSMVPILVPGLLPYIPVLERIKRSGTTLYRNSWLIHFTIPPTGYLRYGWMRSHWKPTAQSGRWLHVMMHTSRSLCLLLLLRFFVFNRLLHDILSPVLNCSYYFLLFLNFIKFSSVFWRCIMHILTVNCIQHDHIVCAVLIMRTAVRVFQTAVVVWSCGRLLVRPGEWACILKNALRCLTCMNGNRLLCCVVGPIPWGHSDPLCDALSLSPVWTSHAACAIAIAGVRLATPGDWQCNHGSHLTNGPNIFQMLLVL